MSDSDNNQCLFFDARGCGPSSVRLTDRNVREIVEDGKTVVPRAFGLCWEVTDAAGPLRFVEDGGFMLTTETATWLRDKLTAWLDAPRLAARATAEVVAQEIVYGVRFCLLRTPHEWGVGDDSDPVVEWYTGPDAERLARTDYAESRGKALCICGAECDADEIDRSGDEPQCPTCVAEAVAAFKAQRFRCADVDPQGLPDACGWEGVGDDVLKFFEKQDVACPGCGGIVEEIAP